MRNPLTPVIVAMYLVLAGLAVLWSWLFNDLTFHFTRSDDPSIWLRHAGMGVAAGLLVVILTTLATENIGWARALEDEFRKILGPFELRESALVALSSGLAEELMFRGAVQETLGLWPASLIFGLLHVGPGVRYLPWTLYAIAAGFFLGVLYERGGLAPVMLAHALINFCGFARINRRDRDELFLS